jgi:hypothetical protein
MNNDLFRITAGQFQLIPSNEGRLLGGPTVQTNKSKNHKLQFLAKYLWLFVLFACSCSSIQLGSGKNQTRFEFKNFELARRSENKAIVIITQANPGFPNSWPEARVRRYLLNSPIKLPEKKTKTAYDDFIRVLESETLRFTKPVLLVHGDSHIFRIDKPLLNSKTARVIENFTRLETFGTPDVHWIRVTADLNDPNVFTFKPEVVTKNVIDHTEK